MARPTQQLRIPGVSTDGATVSLDGVARAAAGWLFFAVVVAVGGWWAAPTILSVSPFVLLVCLLGMAFIDYRVYQAATPPLGWMAASLGLYSLFVGAVSRAYSLMSGGGFGLITTAAVATGVTAAVIIAMLGFGLVKPGHGFRNAIIAGGIGYFAVVCLSLLIQGFGGASLFGPGILGWALCLFGTAMAAGSLVLATDDIDEAIGRAPAVEASRLGWAYVSTLLWLYMEILRLLARLRGD